MISEERPQLLEALRDFSGRYPHWRLGQLVSNVAGWIDADTTTVSDGQLLFETRGHLARRFGEIANGAMSDLSERRSKLFLLLEELGALYPERSFGQVVVSLQRLTESGIYDVEDDQLIEAAAAHLQSLGAKEEAVTNHPS